MEPPPPVPPVLPPSEPAPQPLPPEIADLILSRRPASTPLPPWWYAIVVVTGLTQLVLSIVAPSPVADPAERLGMVVGQLVVWPLIIVGLFSIGKRFRTTRTRTTILLVIWGLGILGSLGNIANDRARRRFSTPPPPPVPTPSVAPAEVFSASPAPAPVAASAPPVEAAPDKLADAYDFSPGSDERLSRLIEGSRETSYHAVVAGYQHACDRHPGDAVLALEQVKFIEHFAYSEDLTIEAAAGDLDRAVTCLRNRFPNAPGTLLYDLRNSPDDAFEAKAEAAGRTVNRWNSDDQAAYFLLRAQHCDRRTEPVRMHLFAEQSFAARPTPEAGLLLAEALHSADHDREALATLLHPVFDSAQPWLKRQKMDQLFDLGAREDALLLLAELRAENKWYVDNEETAARLARCGEIDLSRAALHAIPLHDFNRVKLLQERFRFELEHGSTAQAAAAYREYRALGLSADPFLRQRIMLLRRHPLAGWTLQDLGGGLFLLALLAGSFALPLVLLVPVHYWSLLRARKGKTPGWPDSLWGLRTTWLVWGTLCLLEIAIFWTYAPENLQAFAGSSGVADAQPICLPAVFGLAGAGFLSAFVLLAHKRAWGLLGPGTWGRWRTLGLGVGVLLALRLLLRLYLLFLPSSLNGPNAAAIDASLQLMASLRQSLGGPGMFALVTIVVPLSEEVLFRGLLLQGLARHIPFGWANLLQAGLFACAHLNPPLIPFYLAMALLAGYFARRSGGLLAPLTMHATNNAIASLMVILMP